MDEIISCPNCGQKNRIALNQDSSQAICAKCWTRLNVSKKTVQPPPTLSKEPYTPPPKSINSKGQKFWGYIFLASAMGGFIWWAVSQDTSNNIKTTTPTKTYEKSKPIPNYPEVAVPPSGVLKAYTNSIKIASLEIRTSHRANYLVKLVSVYSQMPVMSIFVRGGDTISTKVPLGTYEIRYASGEKWYGYEHHFGPETSYYKADRTFVFANTGYTITGYTITLYEVPSGNLTKSRISPSQF